MVCLVYAYSYQISRRSIRPVQGIGLTYKAQRPCTPCIPNVSSVIYCPMFHRLYMVQCMIGYTWSNVCTKFGTKYTTCTRRMPNALCVYAVYAVYMQCIIMAECMQQILYIQNTQCVIGCTCSNIYTKFCTRVYDF